MDIFKNKTWNRIFSIIGFILIFLLSFFSIYSTENKYKKYVLSLYIIFVFYTSIAPNKHLSWEWLRLPLPIIFIWTLFFMYSLYSGNFKNIKIILFTSFIYIFTFYSYYSSNTFGTMWCWIANTNAIYYYFLLKN